MEVKDILDNQRAYFKSGATLSNKARAEALDKLKAAIYKYEPEINAALQSDLGKCATESYMCEVGMTIAELSYTRSHFKRWNKKQRVVTPLAQFHARSYNVRNPYGVILIMSPWNYPFMLAMEPLIGAIAAGNCCVIKPSAYSPATSSVIKKIISECFDEKFVAVVEGGRAENQALLDQNFDYILFTGSVEVGKQVMQRAAAHLTPVTLELGGKSPCIIGKTAKIDLAAKRLAFGKLLNAGQTCVAPDYVLCHKDVQDEFVERLKFHLNKMTTDDLVHIINKKHFDRVMGLIDPDKVVYGGTGNPETLRIEPTIMVNVTSEDKVMGEEIFGPVIPIITVDTMEEAFEFINSRPHPLASYFFSEDMKLRKYFLEQTPFGGGCINDTIIHIASSRLGFGGVGGSGMGTYHGRKSFETFTHEKSIVDKSTWMDLPVRYAPYSKLQGKLLRIFMR